MKRPTGSQTSEPKLQIFKIFYDDESFKSITPPYIPLDNRNGRNDWFELWPILTFLENNELEDDVWYGFVSPKFPEKARLTLPEIIETIADHPDHDVALFSFIWPHIITFRNSWVQGELHHPGLMACFSGFLRSRGDKADLESIVSDFETTVYSNYVVAKPAFWAKWRALARDYVDYVEQGGPDLPDNSPSLHDGPHSYQLKVFVQERLANWILLDTDLKVVHPDYTRSVSLEPFFNYGDSRALRMALRITEKSKSLIRKNDMNSALVIYRVLLWIVRVIRKLEEIRLTQKVR